jgi:hypothetical protein
MPIRLDRAAYDFSYAMENRMREMKLGAGFCLSVTALLLACPRRRGHNRPLSGRVRRSTMTAYDFLTFAPMLAALDAAGALHKPFTEPANASAFS